MTLNIKSIKRTRIGRLWLAEFVRRTWDSLTRSQRDSLLSAKGKSWSKYTLLGYERIDMISLGLVAPSMRRLTALGSEVAAHGRRQAKRRR